MATKKAAAKKTTALTKWQEKFADYAKAGSEQVKNIGAAGTSIKFGRGTITAGGTLIKAGTIEVVVLGYCAHNRWYKGEYDPNSALPPDCYAFADSMGDPEMAPPAVIKEPVSPKCADCELNVYGSGRGNAKACQNTIRLGCLLANDLEDATGADAAKADLATAHVSPTNLRYWKAYVDTLEQEYQLPPWAVVTQIQAFDDPKTQIRLEFSMVSKIEDDEILTALEKRYLKVQDALQVPYSAAAAPAEKTPRVAETKKFARKQRKG